MPNKQSHLSFYWYLPPIFLSDAALAYAIDLATATSKTSEKSSMSSMKK